MISRRGLLRAGGAAIAFRSLPSVASTPNLPTVVHISGPGEGFGKPAANGLVGVMYGGRFVEKEFADTLVKIEWVFIGPGIAINEGFANGQIDIASIGVLPATIGKAGGVPSRLISAGNVVGTVAIGARGNFPGKAVRDLKGYTVATAMGSYEHLSLLKILAAAGLSEKDVRIVDLKGTSNVTSALLAGAIDATTTLQYEPLQRLSKSGRIKILYSTLASDPAVEAVGTFAVRGDFFQAYPEAVHRYTRALINAVHWASLDENRETVFQYWTTAGTPIASLRQEFKGRSLKEELNPLIDAFRVAQFKDTVSFAQSHKLIRDAVDVDAWLDPSVQKAVIAELNLQNFWPAHQNG